MESNKRDWLIDRRLHKPSITAATQREYAIIWSLPSLPSFKNIFDAIMPHGSEWQSQLSKSVLESSDSSHSPSSLSLLSFFKSKPSKNVLNCQKCCLSIKWCPLSTKKYLFPSLLPTPFDKFQTDPLPFPLFPQVPGPKKRGFSCKLCPFSSNRSHERLSALKNGGFFFFVLSIRDTVGREVQTLQSGRHCWQRGCRI